MIGSLWECWPNHRTSLATMWSNRIIVLSHKVTIANLGRLMPTRKCGSIVAEIYMILSVLPSGSNPEHNCWLRNTRLLRASLTPVHTQAKDVTPGRIASNFRFNSTQTRSCNSAPSLPLVRPAVGVILQSGTYWPWVSVPALAP